MRYFLIAVAIGGFLLAGWLVVLVQLNAPPDYGGGMAYLVLPVGLALAMALAAIGLVMRRAWGAYLLGAIAFLSVLPIVGLMMVGGLPTPSYASDRGDPAELILVGALAFAIAVGGFAVNLGRSMGRARAAPE